MPMDGKSSLLTVVSRKSGSACRGCANGERQAGTFLGKLLGISAIGDQQLAIGRDEEIARNRR